MKRFFVSLTMLLLLTVVNVFAQTAKSKDGELVASEAADEAVKPALSRKGMGTITGIITDAETNNPLPGAVVIVLGTELGANADSTGRFIIVDVKPGTYSIQARMLGYESMTVTKIKVGKGYTVQIDFLLRTQVLLSAGGVIDATKSMVITDAAKKTTVVNTSPTPAAPVKPSNPAAPGNKGAVGGRSDEMAYFKDSDKKTETLTETGSVASGKSKDDGKIPATVAPAAPMEERTPGAPPPPSVSTPRPRPASPGMKAGSNDDNKQFNYYLGYLEKFKKTNAEKIDVSGRVVFTVTDADGRPVANCRLAIKDGKGSVLATRKTYADGRALFFTTEQKDFGQQDLKVEAGYNQQKISGQFSHNGKSQIDLKFPVRRQAFRQVPLDVVFLLDCTGSMGDEIARLKATLQVINFQASQLPSRPALRFGMVQYRDRGDEYVTRITPLFADADSFQRILNAVTAGGGGDEPEDVQSGLKDAVTGMAWREDACKLVFLVADAPPHLDYEGQDYNYADAMRDAAGKGIKIITVGASGLNDQGEYIFRQLSQYTMGQFVFLTYGEKGEVSGGGTTYVSHHTGSNFQTENLDAIIVRIIKQELVHYGDGTLDKDPEYFETNYSGSGDKEGVLGELFAEGIRQLLDYSIVRIGEATPAAVMPVTFSDEALRPRAEVLEDKIVLNLAPVKAFRLVERKDLRQIMQEQRLSLTGAFDDAHTIEVGKLIGAKILILPKLYKGKDKLELYLKLVKVETGEIMSITLLKLDEGLI